MSCALYHMLLRSGLPGADKSKFGSMSMLSRRQSYRMGFWFLSPMFDLRVVPKLESSISYAAIVWPPLRESLKAFLSLVLG